MNLWTIPALGALTLAAVGTVKVPRGTDIPVTIDQSIPVKPEHVGQTYPGHVTRDVMVGSTAAIPEGSPVEVKLTTDNNDRNRATLRLTRIKVDGKEHGASTDAARTDTDATGLSTGEKTAAGAVAGAVVGAVTGAGLLEGAVLGAGGGLAWGLLDKQDHAIKENAQVRFALSNDLDLK